MLAEETSFYKEKPGVLNPEVMQKYIKPLPKDTAFKKGVEYFTEIFVIYGMIMGVSFWELKKAHGKNMMLTNEVHRLTKENDLDKYRLDNAEAELARNAESRAHMVLVLDEYRRDIAELKRYMEAHSSKKGL